ncbi:hypothetical protein [Methylobacter sp.]|uniref:hypothetical protein n=1 Tax=Methylobacter sp. TaxID=2051955 RepID=UPI003DA6406E
MNPEVSKLLLEIARCPNVQKCYNESTKYHPCSSIVLTQNVALDAFHLPEPWNGEIDTAPILFISSNPSININEIYPIKLGKAQFIGRNRRKPYYAAWLVFNHPTAVAKLAACRFVRLFCRRLGLNLVRRNPHDCAWQCFSM